MASTIEIEGIELTRYVQSSFKIKTPTITIFVDPHRLTKETVGDEKADLVLITHPHFDHLDPDAVDAVRGGDTVIVTNMACAPKLQGKGRLVAPREGPKHRPARDTHQGGSWIQSAPSKGPGLQHRLCVHHSRPTGLRRWRYR